MLAQRVRYRMLVVIMGPGHSNHQGSGGLGRGGFGPNALAVSRCGRFVRDISRWRA